MTAHTLKLCKEFSFFTCKAAMKGINRRLSGAAIFTGKAVTGTVETCNFEAFRFFGPGHKRYKAEELQAIAWVFKQHYIEQDPL